MNTRLKRENRGVLIIFILIIILFFSNIFGASGQPYSYTDYITGCVLNIPPNVQIEIPDAVVLKLTNIIMGEGSSLVNNGTIKIVESCESDTYADFDFDVSCYQYLDNSHAKNVFTNNGSFYCKNYNQKIITKSYNNGQPIYWTNTGEIICSGDFNMEIPWTHVYNSHCNSKLKDDKISFYINIGYTLNLDGIFECEELHLKRQSTPQISFGSDCEKNDVNVSKKFCLEGGFDNGTTINIGGYATFNEIDGEGNSAVNINVTGNAFIGNIKGNIVITGTENSQITLCYNKKMSTHKTDKNSTAYEDWGDGYAKTNGIVKFRVPVDGEDVASSHTWYYNLPTDEYTGDTYHISKYDVQYLEGADLIPTAVSYEDCINRQFVQGSLMPIELVSFEYKDGKFIWTTASETNNDYFVVEYSGNGYDWVECTEHIGSLSNTGYTYSAVPIIQINKSLFSYFRLKQVDLDGKYSYSRVIAISFIIESPCSDEYEGTKIQIRELRGKWFRRIDGGLIYCDKDNQESH